MPIWHYIACMYYMLISLFGSLGFIVIFLLAPNELSSEQSAYLNDFNLFNGITTIGATILYGLSVLLLFVKQRIGLILFVLAFLLRLINDVTNNGIINITNSQKAGHLLAYLIPITLIYLWQKKWHTHLR